MIANLSSDGLSVRKTLNEEGREACWELDLAKRGAPCGNVTGCRLLIFRRENFLDRRSVFGYNARS